MIDLMDGDGFHAKHALPFIIQLERVNVDFYSKNARCLIKILSAAHDVGDTEIYDIHFDKGTSLDSTPHKSGCVDSLTVLEGCLSVTS